jgi:hypothetical protein
MIAFATTCKGRVPHVKQTLPQNLADNAIGKFILVDYGGDDELQSYVRESHMTDIESGRLVYYRYPYDGSFRMAHAKNMAHRCAMMEGAEILVNLDADNLTGTGFDQYVKDLFDQGQYDRAMFGHPNCFLWARMIHNGQMKRGVSGRIAMTARSFLLAGGYDERFEAWGPDDKDMNMRLQRFGLVPVEIESKYLDALLHRDKLRFREYPDAAIPKKDSSDLHVNYTSRDATVVNFGKVGCGTVYRNFWPDPIEIKPLPTRIFGIGMQKTATTSLDHALKILGFDSAHWIDGKWAVRIMKDMRIDGRSRTLEQHYALCDLPIPIIFKQLDRGYPGSKFILTIRDEADWLMSARDHWSYERNPHRAEWDMHPGPNLIHRETYGREDFDALTFLERYRRHNGDVRQYFRDRPEDLLVLDMTNDSQELLWAKLCGFLGRHVPSVPYPRAYATY